MIDPLLETGVAEPAEPHLSAAEVAAYVDGQTSANERRQAEVHLAECDTCFQEMVAVKRMLRELADPEAGPPSA